jgi:hypothetical protein
MAKVNKITGRAVKKKIARARARSGTAGAPLDKGYGAVQAYFHMEVDKKDLSDILKRYIKKNRSKEDQKVIFANAEYNFTMFTHYCAAAFWLNSAMPKDDMAISTGGMWYDALDKFIDTLYEKGKPLLLEKEAEKIAQGNVITLSPMQKLQNKINNTIMFELDDLEDAWMNGEKAVLDVYLRMKFHGLGGSATKPVASLLEGWLLDYSDAYHKRCEQAVEGYSHLNRPEIKRRMDECEKMLGDLEKLKASTKATRTVKMKKAPSLDKQISRLKYKKEDNEYKISSIAPAMLVGALCAFVFNTKYKTITKYVSETGLMVSGSTLKNINLEQSIQNSLRKPNEFLPIVLTKSEKQIDKAWSELTTKSRIPNGRINGDTIILRVLK